MRAGQPDLSRVLPRRFRRRNRLRSVAMAIAKHCGIRVTRVSEHESADGARPKNPGRQAFCGAPSHAAQCVDRNGRRTGQQREPLGPERAGAGVARRCKDWRKKDQSRAGPRCANHVRNAVRRAGRQSTATPGSPSAPQMPPHPGRRTGQVAGDRQRDPTGATKPGDPAQQRRPTGHSVMAEHHAAQTRAASRR